MKKILAIIICIIMCGIMVACSSKPEQESEVTASEASEPAVQKQAKTQEDSVPEKVYKIKLNTSIAQGTPRNQSADICYAETFKENVEQLSNGAIEVEVYYGNSLGSDSEVAAGLSNGSIEFLCSDITTLSSYYAPSLVLSIPGVISTIEEANKLFDSQWGTDFVEECAQQSGIRVMSTIGKGFRNFTTVNKPIKTPADMNGLTLRVINNPLYIEMIDSLSANAVPMSVSELYTALQNGVVDGHENSIPNILQDKTYELEKYLVLDAHTGSYFCGMISEQFYTSLPNDLKVAVDEANRIATEETRAVVDNIISNGIEILKENGVEIYEPTKEELADWHAAYAENTLALAKKEMGEEIVNEFMGAVEKYCK